MNAVEYRRLARENANGIIPFKNSQEVDIMLKQLKNQAVENGE